MLYLLIISVQSQTYWDDPITGQSYNWKSMKKSEDNFYQVIDSTTPFFIPSIYSFNLGADLPVACAGQYPAAMESIELQDGWMESCSILGRSDMQTVTSMTNGIEITYKGGDICFDISSINNRQISFQLICSKSEGQWEIIQSTFTNYCHIILRKKTNAGCPVEFTFTWVWGLAFAFGSLGVYFIVGMIINAYKGVGCIIPNENFWLGVWGYAREMMDKVMGKLEAINEKSGTKPKTYEMV